jgi:hypothetical protein
VSWACFPSLPPSLSPSNGPFSIFCFNGSDILRRKKLRHVNQPTKQAFFLSVFLSFYPKNEYVSPTTRILISDLAFCTIPFFLIKHSAIDNWK